MSVTLEVKQQGKVIASLRPHQLYRVQKSGSKLFVELKDGSLFNIARKQLVSEMVFGEEYNVLDSKDLSVQLLTITKMEIDQ